MGKRTRLKLLGVPLTPEVKRAILHDACESLADRYVGKPCEVCGVVYQTRDDVYAARGAGYHGPVHDDCFRKLFNREPKLALGDELLMTVNAFNREANARYPTEGTFKRNFPIGGTCTICTIAHDLIMVKSEHKAITGIDRQSAIEMRQAYLDSVNAD